MARQTDSKPPRQPFWRQRVNRTAKHIRLLTLILCVGFALFSSRQAKADLPEINPLPFKLQPQQRPLTPHKEPQLEDLFQHTELAYFSPAPVSLEGTNIPGLLPAAVRLLAYNRFVVVDNPPFPTMVELYRDNRLKCKPNFVTADSIVHHYFAFGNGLCKNVIEQRTIPSLRELLKALLQSARSQYEEAQDADVREDVERNYAFLAVAVKLLDPAAVIENMGNSRSLIESDLANVTTAVVQKSSIFGRNQDFSEFQPYGWYLSSNQLSNYFRCQCWLSHMYFTLSDVPSENSEAGNSFRRSLLLYKLLADTTVKGTPAIEAWSGIVHLMRLTGTSSTGREMDLQPERYASVFSTTNQPLQLNALAEPFYRTKLLLSMRRQKPMEIGSTSIFDLSRAKPQTENTTGAFRLFPVVEDPLLPWLRARAHGYTPEGNDGPECPLALLSLHAHGATPATNVLAESIWHLDPALARCVPELMQTCKHSHSAADSGYSVAAGRWEILSAYFKTFPEGADPSIRSEQWSKRKLESAFAAWVDAQLNYSSADSRAPEAVPTARASESARHTEAAVGSARGQNPPPSLGSRVSAKGTETDTQQSHAPQKVANFHYLEPCSDLYRKMEQDSISFEKELSSLGMVSPEAHARFSDFSRLFGRLAKISEREVAYQPLSPLDMKLLSTIDVVLANIDAPLAGTISLNTGVRTTSGARSGCNLALGRPGYLYIICQTTQGPMLCRGALYSYFEVPGGPLKSEHWQRKLEYGLMRPPAWTTGFDIVQEVANQSK